MRRLMWTFGAIALLFGVAQFIRPPHDYPPIDPSQTLAAHLDPTTGVAEVLERSCGDCHSNATVWPTMANIAPLSWVMAYAVNAGRKAVNFSEWGRYPPPVQRSLLEASCHDVQTGKMPSVYTWFRLAG